MTRKRVTSSVALRTPSRARSRRRLAVSEKDEDVVEDRAPSPDSVVTTRELCLTTWRQSWVGAEDSTGLRLNAAGYAGCLLETRGSALAALAVVGSLGGTFAFAVRHLLRLVVLEEEAARDERKVAS